MEFNRKILILMFSFGYATIWSDCMENTLKVAVVKRKSCKISLVLNEELQGICLSPELKYSHAKSLYLEINVLLVVYSCQ